MKAELSLEKLRGGFYTPENIAKFITNWAIQAPGKILEPACGDGIFLKCIVERLERLGIGTSDIPDMVRAIEIVPTEAEKARKRLQLLGVENGERVVQTGDFFGFCLSGLTKKERFDVVVGNPPFIRYQNFLREQREIAMDIMSQAGLHPNRLTNTWVPFLVGSSLLLSENGRIGMVLPAELLQVNYASQVREFLSEYYKKIILVTFKHLVIDGIQEEVVLFLAERKGKSSSIRVLELKSTEDLKDFDKKLLSSQIKPTDHSKEKWTLYFLDKDEILLLRKLRESEGITRMGEVLDADVGVVTGDNDFFILSLEEAKKLGILDYTVPIVTRSSHFNGGIIFTQEDLEHNLQNSLPTLLLKIDHKAELSDELKAYLKSGEKHGVNKIYKCRIRDPWYVVPSTWVPEGFMLRQIHEYPRIIANRTNATSTDTIHRIKMISNHTIDEVAVATLNSLTFAFSEIMGRSYGGGVLELYPSEIAQLPIPLEGARKLDINRLNRTLKEEGIDTVLNITDEILLHEHLGLTRKEIVLLRDIWQKLRDRRLNRRRNSDN
jgi:adenine-specific DNA-methyltransferase